jgi:hypothetical protein
VAYPSHCRRPTKIGKVHQTSRVHFARLRRDVHPGWPNQCVLGAWDWRAAADGEPAQPRVLCRGDGYPRARRDADRARPMAGRKARAPTPPNDVSHGLMVSKGTDGSIVIRRFPLLKSWFRGGLAGRARCRRSPAGLFERRRGTAHDMKVVTTCQTGLNPHPSSPTTSRCAPPGARPSRPTANRCAQGDRTTVTRQKGIVALMQVMGGISQEEAAVELTRALEYLRAHHADWLWRRGV